MQVNEVMKDIEELGIITIVDSLSVTSMPVNEFVLYRLKKGYKCKQGLIVYGEPKSGDVKIPKEIRCIFVGNSVFRMKNAILELLKFTGNNTIFHVHQPKSARLFYFSAINMGILNKTLFTVHSTYSMRSTLYKIESWVSVLFPKKVTCVSETSYLEFSKIMKFIKSDNILPIRNGVDVDNIRKIVAEFPANRNIKSLVCVARMIPLKNHKFLIKLLKELPDFDLKLIGKEDDNNEIRKYAKEMGVINRVSFLGLLEREKVYKEMNNCGIYVSASLAEGMPISVLEAMSLGLIPILSPIGPHIEIAKECANVYVAELNLKTWKNTILEITNKSDYYNMSNEIINQVKMQFSLDTMHTNYFKLYKEMIGDKYA